MPSLLDFAFRAGPILWQRMSEDMKREVAPSPATPSFTGWNREGLHAAWIGHSTVLLRVDGFTILTDPVFSNRIGLGFGPVTVGMKRLVEPAAGLANIPEP